MGHFSPERSIGDARYCIEQAKTMLESARLMWLKARESVETARKMRADLHAQIEELAKRLPFRHQFKTTLLSGILDAAIEGTGADMGNIQLFEPKTCQLVIYVHRGFDEPFLKFFNSVHSGQAASVAALQFGARVIVPDITNSPIFSRKDLLETMLDAGVRSVQSTPIIGKSGHIWGMLSTHHRTVTHLGKKDLSLLDYFAGWATEILEADYCAARPRPNPAVLNENGHASRRLPSPRSSR